MVKEAWRQLEHPRHVLVIADAHFSLASQASENRWWPTICYYLAKIPKPLGPALVGNWLKSYDKLTQEHLRQVLHAAHRHGHFEYLIALGDHTQGVRSGGMVNRHSVHEFHMFEDMLQHFFPGIRKDYVWGDHDVGNKKRRNWWRQLERPVSGMSSDSIRQAKRTLGKPFFVQEIDNWKLIFVNSEIVEAAKVPNYNPQLRHRLSRLVKQQQRFLLRELASAKQALLFVHDPIVAVNDILPALEPLVSKVKATFAGHLHAKILGEALKLEHPLARQFKLQIVPATWGFEGFGGGYTTLTLHDDHLETKTVYV